MLFEFPWPPRELSPNVSVHWRALARVKRQYKEDCRWVAYIKAREAPPGASLTPPVKAHVTFINNRRRRDDDNARASLKVLWDALVEVGILEDDSHDKLEITSSWEVGKPLVKVELHESDH